jgi:tetratricopeptide (TPR) repeat protein
MAIYSACKALVIGVSRYADPQYDLSYARSDAEAVAETLKTEFGFDQVWTLYDNDATRQSIIRFFEQDLQRADGDDGLVIFFAGHGITVTSAIGDDRGFLVPHDGDPRQPYANLSLTAVRDDYLPMVPAKHVFLIVDSCYGGLALRDVATIERLETMDEPVIAELTRRDRKVRQVLAAGTKDQRVLDGGLFGHSVFTGRLIEALREADPYVTADHIGVHVRERVARDCADRHRRQTPQFGYLAGGDGSFVFCRRYAQTPEMPPDALADLAQAKERLEAGELREAMTAARSGVAKEPLSYELRRLVRDIEARIREGEQGEKEAARKKADAYVSRLLISARGYERDGDLSAAIECLEEGMKYQPHKISPELERLRQRVAIGGLGRAAQLRLLFRRAKDIEPSAPEAALAAYQEALRIYPGNARAEEGIKRCRAAKLLLRVRALVDGALRQEMERSEGHRSALARLKADLRQCRDLAMEQEADKTAQELLAARKGREQSSEVLAFLERCTSILGSSASVIPAWRAIEDDAGLRETVLSAMSGGIEIDTRVLMAVAPRVVRAKRAFDRWCETVLKRLAEHEEASRRAQAAHEAAQALEARRAREEYEALVTAYQKACDEERARVSAEQKRLDHEWGQLPWYRRAVRERRVAEARAIPKPERAVPLELPEPSVSPVRPPALPSACRQVLREYCVESLPEDIRPHVNVKGLGKRLPDRHAERSGGVGQARRTASFAFWSARKPGVRERDMERLLYAAGEVLADLLRANIQVRVRGLGTFRRAGGVPEFVFVREMKTTSRVFKTRLRARNDVDFEEVNACIQLLGRIPEFCRTAKKAVSLKPVGTFCPNGSGGVSFRGSPGRTGKQPR